MEFQVVEDVTEAAESVDGILDGLAPDDAMDVVTFFEKKFGKVGSVLSSDAGNECSLGHIFVEVSPGWGP